MTSATIAPALRDHVGRKAIAGRPVAAHGDLFRASMVGLAAFLLSLQFFPLYTQGDQYFYTLAYDLSAGAPFGDVQETYRLWTGSSEPVFVLIMFLLQLIAGKIVASSIINGLLSAGTYLVCKKLRIPIPLMCLGFCSLYYLVLLFSAERLGLAFTFLAYGALVSGKSRGLFVALSVLSHFSVIALLGFIYSRDATAILSGRRGSPKELRNMVVGLVVGVALLSPFADIALSKFQAYTQFSPRFKDLIVIATIVSSCVVLSREKVRATLSLLPLVIGILLVGGFRFNMLAFIVAIFFLRDSRLGRQLVLYPALLWTCYRGLGFVENVFTYGTGFPNYLINQ